MDLDELDGDDAALTSVAVAVAGTTIDGRGNTGDASASADNDGVCGGSGVAGPSRVWLQPLWQTEQPAPEDATADETARGDEEPPKKKKRGKPRSGGERQRKAQEAAPHGRG